MIKESVEKTSATVGDMQFDRADSTTDSNDAQPEEGTGVFRSAGCIIASIIGLASLEGRQAMHYATRLLMCAIISALLAVFMILFVLVGVGYYLYQLGLQPELAGMLMIGLLALSTAAFAWAMRWYSNRSLFTETRKHLAVKTLQLNGTPSHVS